jgi:HAD superfamily hydrolase (TIGR01484 family)
MMYRAIASDYDGTLATDGLVEATTIAALERWKEAGRKLVLITGRGLDDLIQILPRQDLFDWLVAENGAVLYQPQTGQTKLLIDPPTPEFITRLHDRILETHKSSSGGVSDDLTRLKNQHFPLYLGKVIVATWEPYSTEAIAVIQEMGLDLQVILNKGAVMILPNGIDKAFGLHAVAKELEISIEQIIGVGDAENDRAFLEICGYSVAVANALPTLKAQVNWVTEGDRGDGVVELIDRFCHPES